jgi:conjugative transfer signal peptidase TraF
MKKFGHLDPTPFRVAGWCALTVAAATMCAAIAGIRVNTTYSLPLGLYVATKDRNARLVEFCPKGEFASQSAMRGYRTAGFACPDGAVPLLKPIVASEGDVVEVSPDGIAVNRELLPQTRALSVDWAGRPLQPFPCGTYSVEPGTVSLSGWLAWRGELWLLPLALVMPFLVARTRERRDRFAIALCYYAASSWPLVAVSQRFFQLSLVAGLGILLAACLILASTWTLGPLAGYVATSIPPIGVIGWASPLLAAGVLFPALGLFGLAMTVSLSRTGVRGLIALALASGFANATYRSSPVPDGWIAFNLPYRESDLDRIDQASAALYKRPKVTILPEGALPHWNDASREFLQAPADRWLIAGSSLASENHLQNGALVLGPETETFAPQRIPPPLAMWNPFSNGRGFTPSLTSSGVADVGPMKTAILICYEQLLVWPVLLSASHRPEVLVGLSSTRWTGLTSLPQIQNQCLVSWARLLAVPVLKAETIGG